MDTNPAIDFVAATDYVEILGYIGNSATTGTNPCTYEMTLTAITAEGTEIPVAGATPSITALPGAAYNCIGTGTAASPVAVTELAFTPSSTGICSVRFVSGTTATVLTLPSGVKMPDWWTGTEANRTYEISIADGMYGVVTSWA